MFTNSSLFTSNHEMFQCLFICASSIIDIRAEFPPKIFRFMVAANLFHSRCFPNAVEQYHREFRQVLYQGETNFDTNRSYILEKYRPGRVRRFFVYQHGVSAGNKKQLGSLKHHRLVFMSSSAVRIRCIGLP